MAWLQQPRHGRARDVAAVGHSVLQVCVCVAPCVSTPDGYTLHDSRPTPHGPALRVSPFNLTPHASQPHTARITLRPHAPRPHLHTARITPPHLTPRQSRVASGDTRLHYQTSLVIRPPRLMTRHRRALVELMGGREGKKEGRGSAPSQEVMHRLWHSSAQSSISSQFNASLDCACARALSALSTPRSPSVEVQLSLQGLHFDLRS